jgi:hypothetical protein
MWSLVVAIVLGPLAVGKPCDPEACLAMLRGHSVVEKAMIPAGGLVGLWAREGMLSGRHLYLFHDGSYFYTESGDLLSETIFDRGRWQRTDWGLEMSPDITVTWTQRNDRRYLAIVVPKVSGDVRLLGLDKTWALLGRARIPIDSEMGAFVTLEKKAELTQEATEDMQRRLLKDAWRPEHFGVQK